MKYIENKYAEIRWNQDIYEGIKKIVVYRATDEDIKNYTLFHEGKIHDSNHIEFYKAYQCSLGRGCKWWHESTDMRLYEGMRILLECKNNEILKAALYQLGKIEDFEVFRILLYNTFGSFLPDHSYTQFKEALYPDDMIYH